MRPTFSVSIRERLTGIQQRAQGHLENLITALLHRLKGATHLIDFGRPGKSPRTTARVECFGMLPGFTCR